VFDGLGEGGRCVKSIMDGDFVNFNFFDGMGLERDEAEWDGMERDGMERLDLE